ncbi:MAG: DNA sulfur modification protein DndD, partial [Pigmentiphaga sp.]
MILDELTVQNFGVYGGRQSIDLSPDAEGRPIILIGGLNGRGKTTLLDALQLCLYGPAAQLSNRSGLPYEEYLRRCAHRSKNGPVEVAVEVAFRAGREGVEEAIRLRRHWTPSERTCRERFEVLRNGEPDHRAADQWTELVEGYMPSRIAPLFLFDGEKIERYADLMSAGELIETAVQNLLGLDVVDTLVSSLGQLERRKRLSLKVPNEALEAETIRARIRELERERSALVQERASVANQVDRAEKAFALANDRYTREGGPLFQRRDHTLSALGQAEEALEQIRREQRELAGGVAPFLLLPDLLQAVTQRDELEDSARSSREILDALKQEFSVLEEASFQWDIGDQMKLRSHMAARLRERANAAAFDIKLDLTRDARSSLRSLLDRELPHAHGSICVLARNEKLVIGRIEELRAEIDAIPTPEAAEDLIFRLDQAKAELDRLSL